MKIKYLLIFEMQTVAMVTKWRNIVEIIDLAIFISSIQQIFQNICIHQCFKYKDAYFKYLGFQWKVAIEIAMFKYFLSNQHIFERSCYSIVLMYVTLVIDTFFWFIQIQNILIM